MAQTIKLKRSSVAGRVPTTSDLDLGEVAINTADGKMYIKKDTGGTESIIEIGSSGVTSSFTLYEYTATASQTTFSGVDSNSNTLAYDTGTPPKVQVFLNGVLLDFTTDYTATNGTSVSLTVGANAGDLLQVAAYKSVTVDSDIALGDNTKLLLGNDSDFWAYHDGSNTIFNQTGTGNLLIQKDETTVAEVTASGITLTGELDTDTVQFDTTATGVTSAGQISWNTDTGTLELGLNADVNLELGEQNYFQVKAGQAISKGDVVYASGAVGSSSKIIVSKFIANGTIEEQTIVGVAAEDLALNDFGFVIAFGTLRGLQTDGQNLTTPETWNLGDILYASPSVAGELTKTLPVAPNQAIPIAFVTSVNSSAGSLAVRAYELGSHLGELHDVYIASETDNDILQWSTANSRWENVAGTTTNIAEGTNLYWTTARGDSNFTTNLAASDTDDLSEGVTNLYWTTARGDSNFTTNLAASDTDDLSEGATNLYYTDARFDTRLATKTTTDLTEGTNLYYTSARFDTAFSGKSTTDLSEGTNLYYTDARFDTRLGTKSTTDLAEGTNLYYTSTRFDTAFSAKTTDNLSEGSTNLYYTSARANSDFDTRLATKTTTDLTEGTNLYYTDARVGSYLTTNSYATESYVGTQIANLIDSAPAALDTLNELAAALGDDANFSTTVTNSIATKWTQDNTKISNWDTAYSWGDHALVGYLTGNQTITLTGDVSGSGTTSIAVTIADDSHTHDGRYYTESEADSRFVNVSNDTASSLTLGVRVNSSNFGGNTSGLSGYSFASEVRANGAKPALTWHYESIATRHIALESSGALNVLNPGEAGGAVFQVGGNTVWHAANDGSGSGLDADLLDGVHGSSFLRSDADDTATGIIDFTGGSSGTPAVRIKSGGNSWSEGLAIHPSSDSGYALTFYRTKSSLTDSTNTWAIGNLGQNSTNNFGLLRNGLTGGAGIRPDSIFDVTQAGVMRFGFTPTVGSSAIWHAGNDGSGSGLDADLLDGQQGSYYAPISSLGSYLPLSGGVMTGSIKNNTDGAVIIESNASEANNWLWKEAVKQWGIYYFNKGSESGATIGGYTTVGAEVFFTGSVGNGPAMPSTWTGYQAGSLLNAMISPYNGYIYSSSTVYAASSMVVAGNTVWHAGNDGSGSGLDADLLDGQHGSYYAPASTAVTLADTQTITGAKTFESSTQAPLRLHVTNSSGSWDAMTFQGTDEWGDGINYGVLGGDGTEGIMLRKPHIVWNSSQGAADIRLGRSGGTSSGKWVGMGVKASNVGFLSMETTNVLTWDTSNNVNIPNGGLTVAGNTVWHAGNDGSGSGLDADLLDGIDSSQFLRSDADDTFTGNLTTGADNHITFGPNSTWGSSLRVGGNGRTATGTEMASVVTTDGNLHLDAANSINGIYLNYYAGTNGTLFGSGAGAIVARMDNSGQLYKSSEFTNPYWHAANDGSGSGLDADLLDGYQLDGATSVATRIFNNKGQLHSTYTDFNTVMSPGPNYLQGGSNGPHAGQFYGFMFGLGSDYGTSTGSSGHYASQMYYPRAAQGGSPYLYFRDMESGAWGSWRKVYAGYADSAGSASSAGNADTLDGIDSSSFFRSDANDTASGQYTFSKTDDHAIRVGTIRGTVVGSQSGEFIQLYERVHIGSPNGWGDGATTGAPTYGLSVYGGANLATATGTVTIAGNTAWHAGNDGSGSGLDADLLDGLHASSFLRPAGAISGDAGCDATTGIGLYQVSMPGYGDLLLQAGGVGGSTPSMQIRANYGDSFWIRASRDSETQWDGVGSRDNLIWTSRNDGSGSGLDADSVDGYDSLRLTKVTGGQVSGDWNTIFNTASAGTSAIYEVHNIAGGAHSNYPTGLYTYGGVLAWRLDNHTFKLYSSHIGDLAFQSGWGNDAYSGWRNILHSANIGSYAWTSSNDGSGSGLDADLLDGQQPSALSVNYANTAGSAPANGGTATALNGSNFITRSGSSGNYNTDFSNTPAGGVRHQGDDPNITNNPGGTWWFTDNYRHSNSSNSWGTQVAWGWEDNANRLAQRNVTGGNWSSWVYYWNTGNDGSGSGLDADLLDGQHGSYYQPASTAITTGNIGSQSVSSASNIDGISFRNGNSSNGIGPDYVQENGTGYINSVSLLGQTDGALYSQAYSTAWVHQIFGDYRTGNLAVRGRLNGTWQSWKTVWTSANDGSGSGLDADTVDGLHSNSFALLNTATQIFASNNINYFQVDRGGYCGSLVNGNLQVFSGSNNSAYMSFHKSGHYAVNMGLDADNVLRIGGWSASANRWVLDMSGNMTAAGNVTAYSDIRLKENIKVIPDALEKVQKIRGVTFTRNDQEDKEKLHTGVIAQEVEAVLPEVISEDNLGIKNVAYGNMVGLLIEAIKELKAEVDDLKAQLKEK